jgi:hypothetical protein
VVEIDERTITTAEALEQWRLAERALAVARMRATSGRATSIHAMTELETLEIAVARARATYRTTLERTRGRVGIARGRLV